MEKQLIWALLLAVGYSHPTFRFHQSKSLRAENSMSRSEVRSLLADEFKHAQEAKALNGLTFQAEIYDNCKCGGMPVSIMDVAPSGTACFPGFTFWKDSYLSLVACKPGQITLNVYKDAACTQQTGSLDSNAPTGGDVMFPDPGKCGQTGLAGWQIYHCPAAQPEQEQTIQAETIDVPPAPMPSSPPMMGLGGAQALAGGLPPNVQVVMVVRPEDLPGATDVPPPMMADSSMPPPMMADSSMPPPMITDGSAPMITDTSVPRDGLIKPVISVPEAMLPHALGQQGSMMGSMQQQDPMMGSPVEAEQAMAGPPAAMGGLVPPELQKLVEKAFGGMVAPTVEGELTRKLEPAVVDYSMPQQAHRDHERHRHHHHNHHHNDQKPEQEAPEGQEYHELRQEEHQGLRHEETDLTQKLHQELQQFENSQRKQQKELHGRLEASIKQLGQQENYHEKVEEQQLDQHEQEQKQQHFGQQQFGQNQQFGQKQQQQKQINHQQKGERKLEDLMAQE